MLPVPFGFGWFSSWRLEVTFPTFEFGSFFHHPTKVTNRIARDVKYTTFTQHLGGQIFIFGWHELASSYRVRNQILPFGLFGVSNILTKLKRQIRRIISPKVSCTNNARTKLNFLRLFRGVGFPLHELYPYIIFRWGFFPFYLKCLVIFGELNSTTNLSFGIIVRWFWGLVNSQNFRWKLRCWCEKKGCVLFF